MAGFTIKIEGAEAVAAKFAAASTKIQEAAINELNKEGVLLASRLREAAPRDTSYMATHIQSENASTGNPIVTIRAGAAYTIWVDQGTRPHFPPSDALEGWARRHGFGQGGGFLVARAISRHGTKAAKFIDPVIEPAKAEVAKILEDAVKGVSL